jgi:hypothetical protein
MQTEQSESRRGGFGSLGSIVCLIVLTWAAAIATFPLNDNSFFTHLATGRRILERGSVPSTDPYTFTAQGEPWTVQSWLASIAYASAERLAGDVGLRLLVLALFLGATWVLWKLTAPAHSIVIRFLLLAGALFVVTDLWSERPYMIGVIGLGLIWLAFEGRLRPWVLVPFMWVWVNTHGSWLLAVVLAGAVVLGGGLDRRRDSSSWLPTDTERRVGGFVVLGTLLGAVSPLGPRVLWFPVAALTKSEVFAEVIEWRPPSYERLAERSFLVLVIVTVLLLVQRGSWRLALPAALFAGAGLYAQRNVVMATVVLVAACAHAAPIVGSLSGRDRPRTGPILAALLAVVLMGTAALAVSLPVLSEKSLGGYPARSLAALELESLRTVRVATEGSTGNLLEVLGAPEGAVFVDDRVDMFPIHVFQDSLTLGRGQLGWEQVLDRYEIEAVIWPSDVALASLLRSNPEWRMSYADTRWLVACRRGSACPTRWG